MSATARFHYAIVAGATAVVIGIGFTAAGLSRRGDDTPSPRSADVPLVAAAPPASGGAGTGDLLDDAATTGTDPASSTPAAGPSTARSTSPAARRTPARPRPRTTSRPPSPKPRNPAPETGDAVLNAVLDHINAARRDHGLATLTLDSRLSKASALHNQLMIGGCGLSHQCPGEQSIGPRFSAQGVQWTAAGENIGFGSSGSSDAAVIGAANGLTDSMLAEKPPNDGHRKNLLSSTFRRIGLSVVRDSKGMTWMVQDFVN